VTCEALSSMKTKTQNTITFLIGASGSGKSRHARKLAKDTNAFIIDADEIKLALNKNMPVDSDTNAALHPAASELSQQLLFNYIYNPDAFLARYNKDTVIFDNRGKNWDKVQMRIDAALQAGFKVRFVYVENNLASCLLNVHRRNRTSARKMFLSVCAKDFGGTVYTSEKLKEYAKAGLIELDIVEGFKSVKNRFLINLCNLIVKVIV